MSRGIIQILPMIKIKFVICFKWVFSIRRNIDETWDYLFNDPGSLWVFRVAVDRQAG
jgi:hypothetical protein